MQLDKTFKKNPVLIPTSIFKGFIVNQIDGSTKIFFGDPCYMIKIPKSSRKTKPSPKPYVQPSCMRNELCLKWSISDTTSVEAS